MRVLAGKHKFRNITLHKKIKYQTMLTSIRESIFNVLQNNLIWDKTVVCDLFAGSGILGIEALSWGSKFCFFSDIDPLKCQAIENNLSKMKIDNAAIFVNSYHQLIPKIAANNKLLDLVFLDPPYQKPNLIEHSLKLLIKHKVLNNNAIIVIRTDQPNWKLSLSSLFFIQKKRYGKHYVTFYQWNNNKKTPSLTISDQTKLIILSGPSGVGKKRVVYEMLKNTNLNLAYSISLTTRIPRADEQDGVDYYFLSHEQFQVEIEKNNFIEYAEYVDNYYGTSKTYTQRLINKGKNILFEIEIIGAMKIKKQFKQAIWIFLMPPSLEELKRRIKGRGTESDEMVQKRLDKAAFEIKQVVEDNLCDHYVVNDNLEQTIKDILTILKVS